MTSPQSGMPELFEHDSHEYAMWDAAYVLGALTPTDRREFEAHLAVCAPCREGVAEVSGMPALLSQLDRDQVAEIDEGCPTPEASGTPPVPSAVLTSLLAKVAWRRRRSRLVTWTAAPAAAAALAISVLVGIGVHSSTSVPASPQANVSASPQESVAPLPMAQIGTDLLASTVSLTDEQWGTFIQLHCVCLAPLEHPSDRLAMVVVGRDGSRTRLATWVAHPGHTALPAGSISVPADQIAAVQVVSADTTDVLLERSL